MRLGIRGWTVLFGATILLVGIAPSAAAAGGQVIVPRGSAVQIALVLDHSGGLADAGASARKAVQMAVEKHPFIRGFRVQLNDFDSPCGQPDVSAAVAAAVVTNQQNVAVIGHMCSPDERAALPIYEQVSLVTISGSATNPTNPAFGPDVFNSVAVPDDTPGEGDAWYAQVVNLPSDVFWRIQYAKEFGSAPGPFADLYFDAASLMLDEIAAASTLVNGDLVIERTSLAQAVRQLSRKSDLGFKGVTCWVNLDTRGYRVDDAAGLDQCANTGNGH